MDMNLLHDVTFYVMYAAMAIAISIAVMVPKASVSLLIAFSYVMLDSWCPMRDGFDRRAVRRAVPTTLQTTCQPCQSTGFPQAGKSCG